MGAEHSVWYVHSNRGYALIFENDDFVGQGPDGTPDKVAGPYATQEEAEQFQRQLLQEIMKRQEAEQLRAAREAKANTPKSFDPTCLTMQPRGLTWQDAHCAFHEAICPQCRLGGVVGSGWYHARLELRFVGSGQRLLDREVRDVRLVCTSSCRAGACDTNGVYLVDQGYYGDWPPQAVHEYLSLVRSPIADREFLGTQQWYVHAVYRQGTIEVYPEKVPAERRAAGDDSRGPFNSRVQAVNAAQQLRENMNRLPYRLHDPPVFDATLADVLNPKIHWQNDYYACHEAICPKCGQGGNYGSRRFDVELRVYFAGGEPRSIDNPIDRMRIKCSTECGVGTGTADGLYLIANGVPGGWSQKSVRAYLKRIKSPFAERGNVMAALRAKAKP